MLFQQVDSAKRPARSLTGLLSLHSLSDESIFE
jgi:hypothetical protein